MNVKNYGKINTMDIMKNIFKNSAEIATFTSKIPIANNLTRLEGYIVLGFSVLAIFLMLGVTAAGFHALFIGLILYFTKQIEMTLILSYAYLGTAAFFLLFNAISPIDLPGIVLNIWSLIAILYVFYGKPKN